MDKFSKFLNPGEDLQAAAPALAARWPLFLYYLLITGSFFILYPMFRFGRVGLFLWLVLLVTLFIGLSSRLAGIFSCYLFTARRIIFIQAIGKNYFVKKGELRIDNIKSVAKNSKNKIIVLSIYGRHELALKDRDKIYNLLLKNFSL